MSSSGLPLLRLAGIAVRAHWSVVVVAALLAWGLATGLVPVVDPAAPPWLAGAIGLAGALTLLVSLTVHELAHSLVARRRGLGVDGITLWVFGGVSQIHDDWGNPRTELLVAVVGPLTSLCLAALFTGASLLASLAAAPLLLVVVLQWLALVNGALMAFNLLPAFPLDGGRILRALLWWRSGNRDRATLSAARGGRVVALAISVAGIAYLVLSGDVAGGIWLVFIGWFVDSTARRESRGEMVRRALHGVRVGEAMSRDPLLVPSWLTVQTLFEQYVMRSRLSTFVTHGIDGNVEGLVTLLAMRRVPPHRRSTVRAGDIALPLTAVPVASPGDLLTDLLTRIGTSTEGRALVFDGGRMVGLVSPADVARTLSAQQRASTTPLPV